jgi:hypothetical protein
MQHQIALAGEFFAALLRFASFHTGSYVTRQFSDAGFGRLIGDSSDTRSGSM